MGGPVFPRRSSRCNVVVLGVDLLDHVCLRVALGSASCLEGHCTMNAPITPAVIIADLACGHTFRDLGKAYGIPPILIAQSIGAQIDREYARYLR